MKYFLHDTNAFQDEKIAELFIRFGYEGVGLFFTILERIAAQEKPIKTSVLKTQLHVGKRLEKCWQFMEEIDLISSNNGETFNERILSYSQKYQIQKEKTKERVAKFREQQAQNQAEAENVTGYTPVTKRERNAGKVKESKGKEDNKGYADYDFKNEKLNEAWKDWQAFRTEKKEPLTATAVKKQVALLSKYSPEIAVSIIETSILGGWTGLFPPKNQATLVPIHGQLGATGTMGKTASGKTNLNDIL